jgi:hypothetical protein
VDFHRFRLPCADVGGSHRDDFDSFSRRKPMTFSYSALAPPWRSLARHLLLAFIFAIGAATLPALAATEHVSEANLVLPDLGDVSLVTFLGGISGWTLLSWGLLVSLGGLVFGAVIYSRFSACRYIARWPKSAN